MVIKHFNFLINQIFDFSDVDILIICVSSLLQNPELKNARETRVVLVVLVLEKLSVLDRLGTLHAELVSCGFSSVSIDLDVFNNPKLLYLHGLEICPPSE